MLSQRARITDYNHRSIHTHYCLLYDPRAKSIQSNHSILNEINPEYSLEGLMLKLKAPILWPPDAKSQPTGKDPDAGKHGRQKEKGAAEDETVRQHHRLNGRELEQTLGDSGGQGNLACREVRGFTKS